MATGKSQIQTRRFSGPLDVDGVLIGTTLRGTAECPIREPDAYEPDLAMQEPLS